MQPPSQSARERRQALRGIRTILMASVLFGTMAVCVRVACREMSSSQVAFVRFSGSLLVLLALRRGRGLRPRADNLRHVLLRGLLGAGAILLYYRGIRGAGAGLATLLTNTYPVFTTLFATTLMGERFDARLGTALALSVAGVATVLGPGFSAGGEVLRGGGSALAAAVLSGAAVATARQLRLSEGAFLITTYFMAVGAVVTAPTLLPGLPALSPRLLIALGGVVLTSVGGQVLLHEGLGFAPATLGSLAAATSVVTASVLEAVVLGEHLGLQSLAGACLLIAAVGLALGRR